MNATKQRTCMCTKKGLVFLAIALSAALTIVVNTNQLRMHDASFVANEAKRLIVDAEASGPKYAIFYNAYVNPDSIYHSLGIITEQLAQWQASRYANATLYYTYLGDSSIRFPCPNNGDCKLLMQKPTGWEEETLGKLHEYCQVHPKHNVIYLHSKGSFHANEENNRLRNLITLSALSDACFEGLNNTQCNICSARFSPLPHWHTPGNMWTAKCGYIETLHPMLDFEAAVADFVGQYLTECSYCPDFSVGTGRYASEHWAHTNPFVNPCDVYPDLQFVSGYPSLDDILPPLSLEKAPRTFPDTTSTQFMNPLPGPQVLLSYRLKELQQLYNATPANDSFVWTWYQEQNLL